MGCLSGCLVSSTSIQKLFCGSCSVFKWSFDEFVGKWSPCPIPPPSWDHPQFEVFIHRITHYSKIWKHKRYDTLYPLFCKVSFRRVHLEVKDLEIDSSKTVCGASLVFQCLWLSFHCSRAQVWFLVRKIPWRKKWQPTLVFLPGKSHGQRSLTGYSPQDRQESDRIEQESSLQTQLRSVRLFPVLFSGLDVSLLKILCIWKVLSHLYSQKTDNFSMLHSVQSIKTCNFGELRRGGFHTNSTSVFVANN